MTMRFTLRIAALSAALFASSLATANAEERCTNASLTGGYAFRVDGATVTVFLPGGPGPFAAVGKNTYDGEGGMQGAIVISASGVIVRANYVGTYAVHSDCTGVKSAVFTDGPLQGATVDFDFAIDDDGREIRMIVSDPGFAVSGSARKLFTDSKRKD